MARKISNGTGGFISQSKKKRPGRHSKKLNKRNTRKEYKGQGRRQLTLDYYLIKYYIG